MQFLRRRGWILALILASCGERTELTFENFGSGGAGGSGGAHGGGAGGTYAGGSAGYGAYPSGGHTGYGGYPTAGGGTYVGGATGYGGYPTGGYTGYGGYSTAGYTGYGGYPYPTGGYTGYGGYPVTGGYTGYGGYGGTCVDCPSIYSPSDGLFFPACCTTAGTCGAMTDEIAKLLAIAPTCAEILAPGVPDPLCPSMISVDGRYFGGCCSTSGYCGIDLSAYDLGCQTVPVGSGQYQYCGSDPGVGGYAGTAGAGAGAYAGTGGVPSLK